MQGNGPKRLQLSATALRRLSNDAAHRRNLGRLRPADVTAGMIAASGDIEIMNPKHIICHLDPSTGSGGRDPEHGTGGGYRQGL
jgi:DNA-directed RNA polymerase subunit alpha